MMPPRMLAFTANAVVQNTFVEATEDTILRAINWQFGATAKDCFAVVALAPLTLINPVGNFDVSEMSKQILAPIAVSNATVGSGQICGQYLMDFPLKRGQRVYLSGIASGNCDVNIVFIFR